MEQDPEHVTIVERVPGSDIPVELRYMETWDGLYAPIGLRFPNTPGPHPLVLLASGNGGGGMAWIRDAVANRGYIMDRLLERGYACAWIRYRTEVELGYENGGRLIWDTRQGRDMFNRSPLEYEDEIAIVEQLKEDPRIDPHRVGLIGMSHGGEMVLKITSISRVAAVASGLVTWFWHCARRVCIRRPEHRLATSRMQMVETEKVRSHRHGEGQGRIATIDTPILVMGREDDHLQGIFRTSYELLAEEGKPVEWVSWDHDLHGYVYPQRGANGDYEVNDVQESAIGGVLDFLDKHLQTAGPPP
jgi:dipeptidyl aminopeptidase/acylaminoacyl peptidase